MRSNFFLEFKNFKGAVETLHLTRFLYIPSETRAFICHELLKCTLSVKNELLFLHISTLKYIGYGQVGATEETQISIIEHIVFGGI